MSSYDPRTPRVKLCMDIDSMPDGFEDWFSEELSPGNDAYTPWSLQFSLPSEDEVPGIAAWVEDFKKKFPGHDEVLIWVSY